MSPIHIGSKYTRNNDNYLDVINNYLPCMNPLIPEFTALENNYIRYNP